MSGGGGQTTVQNNQPWAGAQPYLTDLLSRARDNSANAPAYYPGQTYLDPTQGQLGAFDTKLNYADKVFGGGSAPDYSQATDALSSSLTGNTALGGLSSSVNPLAMGTLSKAFSGGAQGVGDYSSLFKTTPDYQGLQGAISAANAPILRQLNQDIIPGLNSRATFLNNPTGGIKTLNRVLPDVADRMSENAAQLTEGERQRSLQAGQSAAQFGLQSDIARGNFGNDFRTQALGLGGLGANISQGVGNQQLQGLNDFGSIYSYGQQPGELQSQFADFGAGFQSKALADQMGRFNYYQNLPQQQQQQYGDLVTRAAGLGGQSSQQTNNPQQGIQNAAALASILSLFL